jgi:hypothetical protein
VTFTDELLDVKVRWGSEEVDATLRYTVGDEAVVAIAVRDQEVSCAGADLFDALVAVRRELESRGILVGINGARRDVYPSQMLRQASQGRFAYVLSFPRQSAPTGSVDILAPAAFEDIGTVEEQRAWFERWASSPVSEESGR